MLNHVGTCVEGWGEGGVYKFTYLVVSEIFSENTFFNFNCCDNQALRKIKSFLEQSLKNLCKWRKSIGEKATGCYQIAVT